MIALNFFITLIMKALDLTFVNTFLLSSWAQALTMIKKKKKSVF